VTNKHGFSEELIKMIILAEYWIQYRYVKTI